MFPKIILYRQKTYSDGSHPVCVQVVIDSKNLRKVLFHIKEEFWDQKNLRVKAIHPLWKDYNQLILQKLTEVEMKCIEAQKLNLKVDREYLFERISIGANLSDVLASYCDRLKRTGKKTASEKFDALLGKISKFKDVNIQLLDKNYMDELVAFLLTLNHQNTVAKDISNIKTALRAEDFTNEKIYKYQVKKIKTHKDKLSKEEFKRWSDIDLSHDLFLDKVKDTFLLSFYLRGRRIGDVLIMKPSDIRSNRIEMYAGKTEKNFDILLEEEAMRIIEKYKNKSPIYILPWLKIEPTANPDRIRDAIESCTALINRGLKLVAGLASIDKNITTHVARHTFTYLADQSGVISPSRLQEMLEHSDLETTMNYAESLRQSDQLDSQFKEFLNWLKR